MRTRTSLWLFCSIVITGIEGTLQDTTTRRPVKDDPRIVELMQRRRAAAHHPRKLPEAHPRHGAAHRHESKERAAQNDQKVRETTQRFNQALRILAGLRGGDKEPSLCSAPLERAADSKDVFARALARPQSALGQPVAPRQPTPKKISR